MKTVVRLALVVCACTAAHTFAASPDPGSTEPAQASAQAPAEATPVATTPATTAPAAPQAATSTSSTTEAPAAKQPTKIVLIDNTPNDEQLKQILAKGYRPERHGDKVLYCRREAQLGTRFETKTCRSSQRILEDEVLSKDATARAQKDNGNLHSN